MYRKSDLLMLVAIVLMVGLAVRNESLENLLDDNAPADGAPAVVTTEEFPEGNELLVRRFDGDLVVETWDGPGMETVVAAPEGKVNVILSGSTLVVERESPGSGIYIRVNNVVYASGENAPWSASVLVRVPVGTNVSIEDSSGDVRIGDTDGEFHLSHSGIGAVEVGRVRSASVALDGVGSVAIDEVNGPMDVLVSGTGSVHVLRGEVDALAVNVSGVGDFSFDGTARDATVELSGLGDVSIARVSGNRIVRQSGIGTVQIGE